MSTPETPIAVKLLVLVLPSGAEWGIPAEVIAKHRARHYADNDPDTTFDEEFAWTMENEFELRDWAANNMNWEDVREFAREITPAPDPDLNAAWGSVEKDVRKVDGAVWRFHFENDSAPETEP